MKNEEKISSPLKGEDRGEGEGKRKRSDDGNEIRA